MNLLNSGDAAIRLSLWGPHDLSLLDFIISESLANLMTWIILCHLVEAEVPDLPDSEEPYDSRFVKWMIKNKVRGCWLSCIPAIGQNGWLE